MSHPPISHVGLAVADLDQSILQYTSLLGKGPDLVKDIPDQKARVAIFSGVEGSPGGRVELVAGLSDDSPISRFIAKRGEGMHHVCLYVDDLDAKLSQLKAKGVRLIDETPRVGVEGHRIAFVHPSSMNGVLIELEERT